MSNQVKLFKVFVFILLKVYAIKLKLIVVSQVKVVEINRDGGIRNEGVDWGTSIVVDILIC